MNKMKTALITGITGQDGAYLTDFLLSKGYTVHGVRRRTSLLNTSRIDHVLEDHNPNFHLHYGDMTDSSNIIRILQQTQPDEIYNLAAQSHVKVSFDTPEYTANADAIGTLRLLEAIRILGLEKKTRIYQASTSELYGKVQEIPQKETTPFYPRSPYGVAKLYAYWITVNYRESYDIYACNGILFNHESPLRGENFVTRKVTFGVAKMVNGIQHILEMGNIDAKRDWGHAKDYVEAMWLMLQQEKPEDFVIATGTTTSIRDFIIMAFKTVDVELRFEGSGTEECAYAHKIGERSGAIKEGDLIMKIHPRYFRPAEVDLLIGDATKAKEKMGWVPKYDLPALVQEMVESDIQYVKKAHIKI